MNNSDPPSNSDKSEKPINRSTYSSTQKPVWRSTLFWLVAFVYSLTIYLNYGFMGTDEYWTGITRYIPAQTSSLQSLVGPEDVKSPLQLLPMFFLSQAAHQLGINSPFIQYRFVQILLGFFQFFILIGAWLLWRKILTQRQSQILLGLLAFYFAAPFAFSRPMFESLAAPWIFLAAACALLYEIDHRQSRVYALVGVIAASLAFAFRPQAGICALIFPFLAFRKRKRNDFISITLLGLFFLFLTGLPDYFLRGGWHFSLKNLIIYNAVHGSEYGQQPWTFYPLMLLALSFSPFLIQKDLPLLELLKKQKSLWIMLILFILEHSLFAQKFERFLIPILPVILILLLPFLEGLWLKRAWVRLSSLILLNGFLWFWASFFPAQDNIIQMAQYLDRHPEVSKVYRIEDTPEWIPEAFIQNKKFQFAEVNSNDINKINLQCSDRIVFAEGVLQQNPFWVKPEWERKAEFSVNGIEFIAYKMNPKNNVRRTALIFLGPKNCPQN